jgi:hypothetical protein
MPPRLKLKQVDCLPLKKQQITRVVLK